MAAYERYDNKAGAKRWHYRKWVTLADGTKKRIAGTPSMNTKRGAEEAERAHVERTLNPPEPVKPERARHRMTDVLDRFLTDYVAIANNKDSERSAKTTMVNRYLRPELGELFIDEVTGDVVATLTAKLRRTPSNRKGDDDEPLMLSAKWVKNILQSLRKVLRWSVDLGMIDRAPKVAMPRVDEAEIRFLEGDELDVLLAKMASEPQWFAAGVIAADAGLRQGELRALKWTDINEVANKLVISSSRWRSIETTTKSRKPRAVPMSKRLLAALHANRASKLRGPYVLSNAKGEPYSAEHMNDTIARFVRAAKLADCTWHTLRHTWITRCAMAGIPAKTIQAMAGHASLATTMRYMHLVAGAADDAIARLEAADVQRARAGHADRATRADDSEPGEVVPLLLVTPKGLET